MDESLKSRNMMFNNLLMTVSRVQGNRIQVEQEIHKHDILAAIDKLRFYIAEDIEYTITPEEYTDLKDGEVLEILQ